MTRPQSAAPSAAELTIDSSPFPFAVGDRVRHCKTGGVYTVLAFARMEADLSVCCVYRHEDTGLVWVRGIDAMVDGRFVRMPA